MRHHNIKAKAKKDTDITPSGALSGLAPPLHSPDLPGRDSSLEGSETDVGDKSDAEPITDAVNGHDFKKLSVLHRPQAKLQLSQPGDPSEEEADRIADQVVSITEGQPALNPRPV